ncbi:hypothetical protein HMPREF1425_00454 [Helicobacter pylori GAM71Ai]|nr:hypothetical protein HMPREF1425_00454 [Helicobacter pylori GAM71Ai]
MVVRPYLYLILHFLLVCFLFLIYYCLFVLFLMFRVCGWG